MLSVISFKSSCTYDLRNFFKACKLAHCWQGIHIINLEVRMNLAWQRSVYIKNEVKQLLQQEDTKLEQRLISYEAKMTV